MSTTGPVALRRPADRPQYRGRTVLPPAHAAQPPARRRRRGSVVARLALVVTLATGAAGCSGSDDGEAGGHGTAREVVDRHVALSASYDLVADCELRHPDFIAEMAAIDGQEPDDYCSWALEPLLADATPEERAATKAKYTNPTITAGVVDGDEAAFTLEASDGSYHEDIVAVEVDGRWFLQSADGTDDEHDHEH